MKLIIDVEKDYYEMIKYNVEHGQDYKPFEIIANGIPYDKYLEERDADAYETGYLQGHIEGYQKAEKDYARPIGEWIYMATPNGLIAQCNKCKHFIKAGMDKNYCGNCGTDMRKGGAE